MFSGLLILLRLLSADGPCTEAHSAIRRSAPQTISRSGVDPVHDAALLGDAFVLVQGEERERSLVRATARDDQPLASMSLRGAIGQETIVVHGDRWWYGGMGERDGRIASTFVRNDGEGGATTSVVPARGRGPYLFLPLRGEQPRGLQFAATNPETTLVTEIDATHAVRTWQVPRIDLLNAHAIAERLPDRRVALFAVRNDVLELLLLRDGGEFTETTMRDTAPFQFATALDDTGRLEMVTGTAVAGGQVLEGAIVDPDHPADARWQTLTKNARIASWPYQELKVVSTPTGFVAAWIDRSTAHGFELQACDLEIGGQPPAIVSIGDPSEGRTFGAFFSMQAVGKELLFFWDDGRRLILRRTPSSITQLAATQQFATLCERRAGFSPPSP